MSGSMRPSTRGRTTGTTPTFKPPAGAGGNGRNGEDDRSQAPSFQNFLGSFYSGLPPMLQNLLPFSPPTGGEPVDDAPKDKRGQTSWQDVSFIHSIPGEDNEEGLVVLADG